MTHTHDGNSRPSPDDKGPWSTDFDAYDRAAYYCEAVDRKGHSATVHTAVKPRIGSLISQRVEDGHTPYKTRGDFIRNAVVHQLRYELETAGLEEQLADLSVHTRLVLAQMREERDKEMDSLVHLREVQLKRYRDEPIALKRLLLDCVDDMERMEPFFRQQMEELVDEYQRQLDHRMRRDRNGDGG